MFLFQITGYDDPILDTETQDLLCQRLEAQSRRAAPGIWKLTDSMDAYAAKGAGREKRAVRYHIYGLFLIILGVFILVPGLMEPRTPALIWAGGFAIFAGVFEFCLVRKRKAPGIPSACQKEAKLLLEGRRSIDWAKSPVKISFDEAGMTICTDKTAEMILYDEIKSAFETEHLWLLIYQDEKALLLQKKDLISGQTSKFFSYILQKIDAEK